MSYAVKEIFSTVQGEGVHSGSAAVFLRFAGCNFWSGREKDRQTASMCPFCDTDFVGTNGVNGGKYDDVMLAAACRRIAPKAQVVVCTGGEPLLQLDQPLIDALRAEGFRVHVETNGSIAHTLDVDWVCCSPKDPARLNLDTCDELKVVIPAQKRNLALYRDHFAGCAPAMFVQPEDGPGLTQKSSTALCVEWVQENPEWRISVQTHKVLGVP